MAETSVSSPLQLVLSWLSVSKAYAPNISLQGTFRLRITFATDLSQPYEKLFFFWLVDLYLYWEIQCTFEVVLVVRQQMWLSLELSDANYGYKHCLHVNVLCIQKCGLNKCSVVCLHCVKAQVSFALILSARWRCDQFHTSAAEYFMKQHPADYCWVPVEVWTPWRIETFTAYSRNWTKIPSLFRSYRIYCTDWAFGNTLYVFWLSWV